MIPAASFAALVSHIFPVCAEKQVVYVDATRDIAFMADKFVWPWFSVRFDPCHAMCWELLALPRYFSIADAHDAADPQQTAAVGLWDAHAV